MWRGASLVIIRASQRDREYLVESAIDATKLLQKVLASICLVRCK